jgi:endogenous inhibitor of DNA gyrase (YacG/DUF329 family)
MAQERKCPMCKRPAQQRYRPFCSKRCADLDLGRWFTGFYAIPVVEEDDEDSETPSRKDGDESRH